MPKAFKSSELKKLQLTGLELPVEVIQEHRQSARVSFGKGKAVLRIPLMMNEKQKEEALQWACDWLSKKLRTDHTLRNKYLPKDYKTGNIIQLRGKEFTLEVNEGVPKNSASGQLKGLIIQIDLPAGISAHQKQTLCSTIISRILARVFHKEIEGRVRELNNKYFGKQLLSVRLKYNSSNWGSCSSKNNINLSTRLLLTPDFITDYVIIHELAHLIHMDHSDQFWAVVKKVMPDYERAERWLKKYGESCNF